MQHIIAFLSQGEVSACFCGFHSQIQFGKAAMHE